MTSTVRPRHHSQKRTSSSLKNISFETGDARDVSDYISEPIDVTISSPPYYGMKDYGVKGQIGYEESYEDYLATLVNVFDTIYKKTKDSGSLWLILDAFKEEGKLRLLPFDLAGELQGKTGWKLRDIIIWNKRKTLPWSHRGNLRHIHEYILFFTKSSRYKFHLDRIRELVGLKDWWHNFPERYNPYGKSPTDIWDIIIPTQGGWGKPFLQHFCPFPPMLVERILLLSTTPKNLVFDPFGGSGIVLAVSSVMGRRASGIEINPEYITRFNSQVFPKIQKMWEERRLQLQRAQKLRVNFRKSIAILRQIKYAKLLRKRLLLKLQEEPQPLLLITHIGNYKKPNGQEKSISCKLTLVYNSKAPNKSTQAYSKLCQRDGVLRSFGIKPRFETLNLDKLTGVPPRLWAYGNGSIYRVTAVVDMKQKDWLESLKKTSAKTGYPILLADKTVDVFYLDEELKRIELGGNTWSGSDIFAVDRSADTPESGND